MSENYLKSFALSDHLLTGNDDITTLFIRVFSEQSVRLELKDKGFTPNTNSPGFTPYPM